MKRGIIITPNYKVINNGSGIQVNGGVDPVNLRKYLLLWDKIDHPVNNMIHIGGGPDIDFLKQEGIATSTEVRFREMRGDQNGAIMLSTQMAAYEEACKNQNEEWSIAQPSNQLVVPEHLSKQQGGLEFELYDAIQIPTGNVSLQDIIEFKKQREPELLALRDSMDTIVDGIVASQDIPKRKNKAISKLHRDLNDFNRVMKETKFERVKRSLKTIATDPWFGVVGAASLSKDFLPENYQPYVQLLNVAGLGGCALKFGYKEFFVGRNVPQRFNHFAYLSSIHRELR